MKEGERECVRVCMYTAESFASVCYRDLLPIVIGGADNARDILISEGLMEEEEKIVKPAKH